MSVHSKNILQLKGVTQGQLELTKEDISGTLEQISSREKYINNLFENLVLQPNNRLKNTKQFKTNVQI
jgi:hypothetical protein